MLGFALRGIVLVGVLGWYSTGIWKMIDGYFKDRFDKYLKEEYARNPRMREDVDAHTRVKIQPVDKNIFHEDSDFCQLDTCPADKVGAPQASISQPPDPEKLQQSELLDSREEKPRVDKSITTPSPQTERQRTAARVKKKAPSTPPAKRQRKKVKTIVLTEDDFEEVKNKISLEDYDFSEFEYDEAPPEGIPVEKLGFKPRADIGNLDRVTEEEFCPMSLDYDGDCGEAKTWP